MKLDRQEKKMLLEAIRTMRQADLDCVGQDMAASYGPLDWKLIRKWNLLIKKVKAVKSEKQST